jgi:deazaflavin-dependent oxidoreductase (nitroreductase family)
MKGLTKLHTLLYNKFSGRFLGTFLGNPICMITAVGRRSGNLRTIPLLTIPYEDDYILVASSGGAPSHPAWYYNLINDPRIEITVNSKTFAAHAKKLSDDEKESIWPFIIKACPFYEEYRQKTTRNIPVFICSPIS